MGGAVGGGTASALTVNMLARSFLEEGKHVDAERLEYLIKRVNDRIYQTSQEYELLSGMGTTVACVLATEDRIIVSNVGDTRVYRLRAGRLQQLTRDHTFLQELLDAGTIKAAEEVYSRIAHVLTRVIGPTDSVEPDIHVFHHDLMPGDIFLICCDGLNNQVTPNEVKQILKRSSPTMAVNRLVSLANQRGGFDNVTVGVISISEVTTHQHSPYGVRLSVDLEIDGDGNPLDNPTPVNPSETPTLLLEHNPELLKIVEEDYYKDSDLPPEIATQAKKQQLIENLKLGNYAVTPEKAKTFGKGMALITSSAIFTFFLLLLWSSYRSGQEEREEALLREEPIFEDKMLSTREDLTEDFESPGWPAAPVVSATEDIAPLALAKLQTETLPVVTSNESKPEAFPAKNNSVKAVESYERGFLDIPEAVVIPSGEKQETAEDALVDRKSVVEDRAATQLEAVQSSEGESVLEKNSVEEISPAEENTPFEPSASPQEQPTLEVKAEAPARQNPAQDFDSSAGEAIKPELPQVARLIDEPAEQAWTEEERAKCRQDAQELATKIDRKKEIISKLEKFPQDRPIKKSMPYDPVSNPTLGEKIQAQKARIAGLESELLAMEERCSG